MWQSNMTVSDIRSSLMSQRKHVARDALKPLPNLHTEQQLQVPHFTFLPILHLSRIIQIISYWLTVSTVHM